MSRKPRPTAFDPRQLELGLSQAPRRNRDGALSGIERRIASAIALIIKEEPRSRYEVAGEVSRLLDDEVSKAMIDAYSSEAKENHNISAGRFYALIAATGRFDIFREFCTDIGVDLVIGDEIYTAELGHIAALKAQLAERESKLKKMAPTIARLNGKGGAK